MVKPHYTLSRISWGYVCHHKSEATEDTAGAGTYLDERVVEDRRHLLNCCLKGGESLATFLLARRCRPNEQGMETEIVEVNSTRKIESEFWYKLNGAVFFLCSL